MKLETKLKQLIVRLPAKQQTLDFSSDNRWQELSQDDQHSCREAIVDLLLHVFHLERDENESSILEDDENE